MAPELRDHLPPSISDGRGNWQKAATTFSRPLEDSGDRPQPNIHQDICKTRNQDDVKKTDQTLTQVGSPEGRYSDHELDSQERKIDKAQENKQVPFLTPDQNRKKFVQIPQKEFHPITN